RHDSHRSLHLFPPRRSSDLSSRGTVTRGEGLRQTGMSDFFTAALGFPTALFSFALIAVVGYWYLVVLGVLGIDTLDADTDADVRSEEHTSELQSRENTVCRL